MNWWDDDPTVDTLEPELPRADNWWEEDPPADDALAPRNNSALTSSPPAFASLAGGFDATIGLPALSGIQDLETQVVGGDDGTEGMQLDTRTGRMIPVLRAVPVDPIRKGRLQLDVHDADPYAPVTESPVPNEQLYAEIQQALEQQDIERNAEALTADFFAKNNAPIGAQARNAFANFAAGAGTGTADAGAALLQIGRDLDDAAGGYLPGSRDLNDRLTRWLQKRSEEIPVEQGVDPALADTLSAKFGQGLGSMVPTLVGGATGAPLVTAAMMYESGRKDAAASGASEADQKKAAYLNAAVGGISERLLGIPALLKSAKASGMPTDTFRQLVEAAAVQTVKSAPREATQEGLQGAAGNLIANSIVGYDPERRTFEGVPEQMFIGALVGGAVGPVGAVGQATVPQRETTNRVHENGQRESTETLDADRQSRRQGHVEGDPHLVAGELPLSLQQSLEVPQPDPTSEESARQAETDEDAELALIEEIIRGRRERNTEPTGAATRTDDPRVEAPVEELDALIEEEVVARMAERGVSDASRLQAVGRAVPESNSASASGILEPPAGFAREESQRSEAIRPKSDRQAISQEPSTEAPRLPLSSESVTTSSAATSRQTPQPAPAEAGTFSREEAEPAQVQRQEGDFDPGSGLPYSLPRETRAAFIPSDNRSAENAFEILARKIESDPAHAGVGRPALTRVEFRGDSHLPAAESVRAAQEIAARHRVNLVFFDSDRPLKINGAWADNRTLAIYTKSTLDPIAAVAGHEVWHSIQQRNPRLAMEVKRSLRISRPEYRKYRENTRAKGYEQREITDEFVADLVGETLRDPARLEQIIGNPSLSKRVLIQVREWIDDVLRYFGTRQSKMFPDASDAVRNLRKARNQVVTALRGDPRRADTSQEAGTTSYARAEQQISDSDAVVPAIQNEGAPSRQPNDLTAKRQDQTSSAPEPDDEGSRKRKLYERLVDENIDDLLSGKLTAKDIREMARREERPTSTKNAVTAQERAERGIPEAQEAAKREFGQVWTEMQEMVAKDAGKAQALMDSLAVNPRPVSDLENALLLQQQITLQNNFDAAMRDMDKATNDLDRQEASARLERARDSLATMYDIDKAVGTETARGLNARKMMARNDYSLVRMEAEMRARANNGKKLDAKQQAIIKDLHQRIAKAEAKIAEYEKRKGTRRTTPAPSASSLIAERAAAARERLRSQRERSTPREAQPQVQFSRQEDSGINDYAIIGAEIIENGATDFDSFSEAMVSEFGEQIRPDLKRIYGAAKDTHQRLSKEARGLEGDKKRIRGRIADVLDKTARGDFSKPAKREPRMDKEKAELLFQLAQAREAYHHALVIEERKKRSTREKVKGGLLEITNTARALMTSFDFSAVLRQGGFIVSAHPFRSAKSIVPMFRAFGLTPGRGKRAEFVINEEIRNRQNAVLYKKAGLFIADERPGAELSKMEEVYASRWANRIPGVGGSQRAYTTFLNKLRADSFDAMVAKLGRNEKVTLEEAKAIANYINVATGRGDMGSHAKAAKFLSQIFFSPRYVLSRFQILFGQPLRKESSLRVKGAIAAEYGRMLSAVAMMYALASWAFEDDDDFDIEWDPRSSDFGKLRFGKTRVDPLFGLQQVTVFTSRMLTGAKKDQSGKMRAMEGRDYWEVGTRFVRSKLAPAPSSSINAWSGENIVGEAIPILPRVPELTWDWMKEAQQSAVGGMLMPMSSGDLIEAMQEQGMTRGTSIAMFGILGTGVQTYDEKTKRAKKQKKATPRDFEDILDDLF